MQAVEPPVIAAPAPAEDESAGVIEVVGSRAEQVQKIDRRTYRVKDNALSAQSDGLQLIRGLPAVIVSPDDQIMLLGSPGVTILIDGRPAQGDAVQTLRTLHGGDIEQIEVITNPSAQYASQGIGGIINFILRKKRDDGLTGTNILLLSSLGRIDPSVSLKEKRGKWTREFDAEVLTGVVDRTSFEKLRTVRLDGSTSPTIDSESGGNKASVTAGSIHGKLTYDLSERSSISGEFSTGGTNFKNIVTTDYRGVTPDFDSFTERTRTTNHANFVWTQLAFDHKGKTQGETLKASASIAANPLVHQRVEGRLDDVEYLSDRQEKVVYIFSEATWEHPVGKRSILTTGGSWTSDIRKRSTAFEASSADPRLGPDSFDEYRVRKNLASTYATFQRKFGTWTVMPGLRMEYLDLSVSSPGRPTVKRERATLFPTFHLEHPLTKTVNLTLSYSKRIGRPDPDQLRPYALVNSALLTSFGNPKLRDETTDAYELNLHYRRKKLDAGVIVYHRRTRNLFEDSYTVNDEGVYLRVPVNAGRKVDIGAQFDVTTPLLKRVKGTASINLFYNRSPIDPLISDEDFESFRYTGNATLEWHGRDSKSGRPGDIAQVQLTYESPSRSYQFRREDYYTLNLSWTHSFTKKLALTASLNGLGSIRNRHHLIAPLVLEDYEKRERPEFKLKLVKTLGKTK